MSSKSASINMTEGPLFKKILTYTLPIMFSGILQLLFNAADLVVVGHWCGETSLGAVGATSSLINLIINFFIGISVGVGICVAHSIGAGKTKDASDAVHTAIPLAIISAVIITAVGVSLSPTFLKLMDTPESLIDLASTYMQIYFAGTIFNMLYNFGAAILRATGDTRSPLMYLIFAGVVNVILNIIFVTLFDMNVAGVALATVASQAISAILVIINLIKRTDACHLDIRKLKISKAALAKIARMGVPSGIQSALFSVSNVLIQASVNPFGDVVISGITAAASIEGFVYTSMNSFMHTTQNFVSQNRGAEKYDRISKVLLISLATVTVVGLFLGVGSYLLGHTLLSIYIKDSEEAISYGLRRMALVACFYFLCGIMESIAGAIRGLGASITPMIVSFLGACVARIVWIYTIFQVPEYHTLDCLYLSYPITWTLTIAAHLAVFIILFTKQRKRLKKQQTPSMETA